MELVCNPTENPPNCAAHYNVHEDNWSIISSAQVHSWDRLHWAASAHTKRSAVHSSVCHVDRSSAAAMLTSRGCSPVTSPDGGYVGTCPPISIASSLPPYTSSPSVPTCRLSFRQLQVPPCMAGLQLCRQPAQHLCVLWERRGGMSRWSTQLLPALNTATGRQFPGQDRFPLCKCKTERHWNAVQYLVMNFSQPCTILQYEKLVVIAYIIIIIITV